MIRYMIMQNVLHRPLRTFITVLAVAVEVTLVIIVVGLTSGLLSESAKRIEGVGADIMVQPPQASYLMAFSGAPMPISIAGKLAQLEYVQAVAPVHIGTIRSRPQIGPVHDARAPFGLLVGQLTGSGNFGYGSVDSLLGRQ